MEAQVELARPQRDAGIGGQREGRAAQLRRVDAEQQVVHDRVADEGGVEDLVVPDAGLGADRLGRSEEHTAELPSLMRISYAVFCLKKKNTIETTHMTTN